MRRALALAALTLLAASPASAQTRFDPQFFHPSPLQRSNATGTYSADVLGDAAFEVGLMGHYDHQPLVLRDANGDVLYDIVGHQSRLHLMGGFGLFDLLEIAADIPLILTQDGDAIPPVPNHDLAAADAGFGVGDVRLMAKVQFFTTHTAESPGGAAMAFVLEGLFPTGEQQLYQGDDWRIAPRLIIDGITAEAHRVSLSLGVTYRQETALGQVPGTTRPSLEVGTTFDWGLAAQFRSEYVHVVPEVRGAVVLTAEDIDLEEIPMEAGMSIRVLPVEQLQIQFGGTVGLFQGFGAPVFRVLLGASWLQAPDPDRDGDGIPDSSDECPEEPEDIDTFEDENGCPDPDNDRDGVLDGPDRCPNVAEDADGFEDEDGCPDPDNDGDGILDAPDACPNDPADMNGVDDEDGCPEVDSDGDGLLDPVDTCPNQPEDIDQFEDEDGCPDNDNDQDRILDADDACPNEAEVVNGVDDEDGCPDESVIEVTCDAIVIHDRIYFETNRDVIQERSFELLNQLAAVLVARPDILRISVEGHTDSQGSDSHNMDLSTRRAASVVSYMTGHGVAASRLTSQGFGETRPIDSNRTRAGRANNRRVEFQIVEQEGCQDEGAAEPAVP